MLRHSSYDYPNTEGISDDNCDYLIERVLVHITSSEKKQTWVDLGSWRKGHNVKIVTIRSSFMNL